MKLYQELSPSEQRTFDLARSLEMQRVRAAKPGEVILFNKLDDNSFKSLMYDFGDIPKEVLFHGMLGIYDGLRELGTFIRVGDEEVTIELNRKHNYELSLTNHGGLLVPFIKPPINDNCMVLKDRAYIGPQQISDVLKVQCEGHFQRFFEDYVKVHRRV